MAQPAGRSGSTVWIASGVIGCFAATIVGSALFGGWYMLKGRRAAPVVAAAAPNPAKVTAPVAAQPSPPTVAETTATQLQPAPLSPPEQVAPAAEPAPAPPPAAAAEPKKSAIPPPKPAPEKTKKPARVVAAVDEPRVAESGRTVSLRVTSSTDASSEITTTLRREVRARLGDSGFELVQNGAYDVDVVLTSVREVSRGRRILIGAFAGKATIEVEVTVKRGGTKLGSKRVETKSGGKTVFSGTSSQAIERAAEQIAAFAASKIQS